MLASKARLHGAFKDQHLTAGFRQFQSFLKTSSYNDYK